jgi:hypothetical protein
MTDRKRCDECVHSIYSRHGHPYWHRCHAPVDPAGLPTWLVRVARLRPNEVPTQGYDEGCPRWEAANSGSRDKLK